MQSWQLLAYTILLVCILLAIYIIFKFDSNHKTKTKQNITESYDASDATGSTANTNTESQCKTTRVTTVPTGCDAIPTSFQTPVDSVGVHTSPCHIREAKYDHFYYDVPFKLNSGMTVKDMNSIYWCDIDSNKQISKCESLQDKLNALEDQYTIQKCQLNENINLIKSNSGLNIATSPNKTTNTENCTGPTAIYDPSSTLYKIYCPTSTESLSNYSLVEPSQSQLSTQNCVRINDYIQNENVNFDNLNTIDKNYNCNICQPKTNTDGSTVTTENCVLNTTADAKTTTNLSDSIKTTTNTCDLNLYDMVKGAQNQTTPVPGANCTSDQSWTRIQTHRDLASQAVTSLTENSTCS